MFISRRFLASGHKPFVCLMEDHFVRNAQDAEQRLESPLRSTAFEQRYSTEVRTTDEHARQAP